MGEKIPTIKLNLFIETYPVVLDFPSIQSAGISKCTSVIQRLVNRNFNLKREDLETTISDGLWQEWTTQNGL